LWVAGLRGGGPPPPPPPPWVVAVIVIMLVSWYAPTHQSQSPAGRIPRHTCDVCPTHPHTHAPMSWVARACRGPRRENRWKGTRASERAREREREREGGREQEGSRTRGTSGHTSRARHSSRQRQLLPVRRESMRGHRDGEDAGNQTRRVHGGAWCVVRGAWCGAVARWVM